MPTPKFWRTIDRLGCSGAALALWRLELGDELEAGKAFLRRVPSVADRIRDPDDETGLKWLTVVQGDSDHVYIAESEDEPAHRSPLPIPAEDAALYVPDCEALRPKLAEELGFTALGNCVGSAPIWQLGFSQPQIGVTTPVFLYMPAGSFSDPQTLLNAIHGLPESVLFVPTKRHLLPAIFTAANARKIAIESIEDRLGQVSPASTSLAVTGAMAGAKAKGSKEPTAILAVQPGWTWEKLRIRLSQNGTLVALYGSARGEFKFGKKQGAGGQLKFSELFKILFRMCVAGRWENPPRSSPDYAATQRNFARLRTLLVALVRIEGDPFRKINGAWEPRFQFEPDLELKQALEYRGRKPEEEE